MLKEYTRTRQIKGEGPRRWFADDDFDLIVWYHQDGQTPVGFQLCYDKRHSEHALTWRADGGYAHHQIDDGEGAPLGHKSSPILLADGPFPWQAIAARVQAAAVEIDQQVARFVYDKLVGFGG